jgi:ABC-type nitrate/sulfonate/bicarbonate transport system substrate-binding protein
MPVSDCAPLVVAHETGLFAKYDLDVELVRESDWASIRDKTINGDLDAAHAPAGLPFLSNLGVDSDPCACVSGLVLSLEGNAITLSRRLWESGVHNATTLRDEIYRNWGKRTYTFAVPNPLSSQSVLLRQWFKTAGIVTDVELRIVAVPPEQMFPTLKLGYIDGYCVGEPWTSVAVEAGAGVCVATSAELSPLHPEKVLMVRQSFAAGRSDEHERLLAALLEACAFCDRPENRPLISEMLAHPHYVNAPADNSKVSLFSSLRGGKEIQPSLLDLNIFHRHNTNEPSDEKAAWIIERLYELLDKRPSRRPVAGPTPVLKNIFRRDIYLRAQGLLDAQARVRAAVEPESCGPLAVHAAQLETGLFSLRLQAAS